MGTQTRMSHEHEKLDIFPLNYWWVTAALSDQVCSGVLGPWGCRGSQHTAGTTDIAAGRASPGPSLPQQARLGSTQQRAVTWHSEPGTWPTHLHASGKHSYWLLSL